MSFNRLFMAVSLILVYVIHKLFDLNHQATPMSQSALPRPDWEPTMRIIVTIGMFILMPVSILTAYMEGTLYSKSQRAATSATTCNGHTIPQGNHHGGNSKDYDRTSCSNQSNDVCNKDRGSGNGHGAATAISSQFSSHQNQQRSSNNSLLNALTSGNAKGSFMSKNNNGGKTANNCTQKRRKNSSSTNSEKVPTNKSLGSTSSDKKSSNLCGPIFQNLTNVISSPPPPLPTFENEFDSLELKKLRGRRAAKKSNSLNGSIASSTDDIGDPNSLNSTTAATSSSAFVNKTSKSAGKGNGIKGGGSNSSINGERDGEFQARLKEASLANPRANPQNRKGSLRDVFTASTISDEDPIHNDVSNKLYKDTKNIYNDANDEDHPAVTPIQPPSSLSSTPSSSVPSTTNSTSSSPPLSASSYGEYSLLGPGATFELPCLRVRSAQI